MARLLLPALNKFKLDTVAKALNVSLDHHHRAVDDAACTAEIFVKFIRDVQRQGMLIISIRSTRWDEPMRMPSESCRLTM